MGVKNDVENEMRFQDRAVLVTGGNGIGQQVCFATAHEANSFITGTILAIDGVWTAAKKIYRFAGFGSAPGQICA